MNTAAPLTTTDLAVSLRASVRGDVVTTDEPSFAAATFGVSGATPELVVIAADAADIARTVRLATRTGRRVVAQIIGRRTVVNAAAADRTILVVTRLLTGVRIDADRRTATVGIGASWRQVLDAAEPFGLTALSAAADALRPHAGAFAFAADRIRSFEVITGSGERRLVGPDSPDFYALRKGLGTHGLVVAMTLDLVPHPALMAAELSFSADDADRVLAGWQRWAIRLPRTAATGVAVDPAGDTLTIRAAHVGDTERLAALLASLRAAVGATPVAEAVGPATIAEVARGHLAADRLALAA